MPPDNFEVRRNSIIFYNLIIMQELLRCIANLHNIQKWRHRLKIEKKILLIVIMILFKIYPYTYTKTCQMLHFSLEFIARMTRFVDYHTSETNTCVKQCL